MDIVKDINRLKEEKGATILAHYYTLPEIQEIADYVGDSYFLSKKGKDAEGNIIVFCGVKFMAESAKLLSPEKKVLFPNEGATCGMARRVDLDKVKELVEEHKDGVLVSYINCSTELKGISYTCVTSASAEKIIGNIKEKKILFVPDRNLGGYISEKFPEKEFILWDGCCCIHDNIKPEDVMEKKEKYPEAKVLVHPECRKEVRDLADYIGSTSGIMNYATESECDEFIIVTDVGILHELKDRNPKKKFHALPMVCDNMKITTLEDVYTCLKEEKNEIIIPEELSQRAVKSLEKMHFLAE
ncbi:quinolinate synthase NadA [Oceanirhabdus seepicola]|uniref:Quinolinate synthase n=1 Tax=Oceanirhabdus seepicola TaxID=2828781 RepID=A0A9J6NX11_9CLOT|nr:quinolinate synthase NadA [Oceanirhabdus seepicola]MCM1988994.1 quinolinate synthase NadA [Oceanirhabdus seepicola]